MIFLNKKINDIHLVKLREYIYSILYIREYKENRGTLERFWVDFFVISIIPLNKKII